MNKYCDFCKKDFDEDNMHMLDDDWWLCKNCFTMESEGCCSYSSYCNYTGNCDNSC